MPLSTRRASVCALSLVSLALIAGACGYVRLLRPNVLKQLNPRVVRLVNELPATDQVNEALIGRLFAHGGAWARGGGTAWITGTYDPELDLVYRGTGNPSPVFDGTVRQGTNLYTSAVVALDPDDGAIRWHYQWTPHDVWDYDGVGESILFEQDGRKLLAHVDRNGYLFILDRPALAPACPPPSKTTR